MKYKKYLCIHGHFYQPPRENPWTGEIGVQESAAPAKNWNERIHDECYLPNTEAKILNDKGKVVEVVNNFEQISFNVGPTLLSWLRERQPKTYQAILEADKKSVKKHQGHGNAIAQCYHHMIMPLANERDKITQVKWGIEDFRFHFGRDPEAMWLPETACNDATLEVLHQFGMKYVILEPHQADAVRKMGDEQWSDVADGSIDSARPYRIFLHNHPTDYVDAFFYDGPLAKGISFGDLLDNAEHLRKHLDHLFSLHKREDALVHYATDGETYGHHKTHSEMGLAYLCHVEAPKHHYKIVNYGEYLAKHPPKNEVRLKDAFR